MRYYVKCKKNLKILKRRYRFLIKNNDLLLWILIQDTEGSGPGISKQANLAEMGQEILAQREALEKDRQLAEKDKNKGIKKFLKSWNLISTSSSKSSKKERSWNWEGKRAASWPRNENEAD